MKFDIWTCEGEEMRDLSEGPIRIKMFFISSRSLYANEAKQGVKLLKKVNAQEAIFHHKWHNDVKLLIEGFFYIFKYALQLKVMKGTLIPFFVVDTRAGVEPGLLG